MNDSENSLEVADCSSETISTLNEFQEAPRKVPESIEQALASVEQALENVREALGTNGKNEDNGVHDNGQQDFEDILSKAVDETILNGNAEPEEEIKAPKQRRRKLKMILLADGSVEEVSCDESDEESGELPQQHVEVVVPDQPVEEVKYEAEAIKCDFEPVGESEVQNETEKEEKIILTECSDEPVKLDAEDEPEAKIEESQPQNPTEALREQESGISGENGSDATSITEKTSKNDASSDDVVEDAEVEMIDLTIEVSEKTIGHLEVESLSTEKDSEPEAFNQVPVEPAVAQDIEIAMADSISGVQTQENIENAEEESVNEEKILEPVSNPEPEAVQTPEEIKVEMTIEDPEIPEAGIESTDSGLDSEVLEQPVTILAVEEENEVKESVEIKSNVEPTDDSNIQESIPEVEPKLPQENEIQSSEAETKAEVVSSPEETFIETTTVLEETVEIPEQDGDEKPIEVVEIIDQDKDVLVAEQEDLEPAKPQQEEAVQIPEDIKVEESKIPDVDVEPKGCILEIDSSLETTVSSGEAPKVPELENVNLTITVDEEDEVKKESVVNIEPISTVDSDEIKMKVEPISSDSEIVVESSTTTTTLETTNDTKISADEVQKDSDKLTLLISGITASANEEVGPEIEPEIQIDVKQNVEAPNQSNVEKQPDPETSNLETDMVVGLQETIADLEKEEDETPKPVAEKKVEEAEPQTVQKSDTEKKVSDSPPKSIREQYKAANAPKPEASKSSCILS